MTDWVLDCFINYLNSEKWSSNVDQFINKYQDKFIYVTDEVDEHLALHALYHDLAEPLLNDFLSEMEITYQEFLKGLDDLENQAKIKNYQGLFNRILAIYDFPIFREVMHEANNQVDIRSFLATNSQSSSFSDIVIEDQELYLDQILNLSQNLPGLRLSKDAYDLREFQLNKRLEHDIYESIELSKDEYDSYKQALVEEEKMLGEAIELSIKEIEVREAEEMALLKPFLKSTATLKGVPDEVVDDTAEPPTVLTEPKKVSLPLPSTRTADDTIVPPGMAVEQPQRRTDCRPSLEELKLRKKYLLERYSQIRDKLHHHQTPEMARDPKPTLLKECNEKLREQLLLIDKGL